MSGHAQAEDDSRSMRAVHIVLGSLVLAAILSPFFYWDGGLIEIETLEFIPQYLADRPFLPKIFDPRLNDLGWYQARELSYVIDYVDANVFRALLKAGRAVFVPLSAVAASILTAFVFLRGARRYLRASAATGYLLLLVYLTNYVHLVTMGMFYRSTKPMLAPVAVATTFYILGLTARDAQHDAHGERRPPVVIFLLLSLMSLLDRQGFFYAIVAFGVLLLQALAARGRRDVAIAAGAAILAMTVYNVVVAPWLVYTFNGYTPSLEYQAVPLTVLLRDSVPFVRATELLFAALSVLAGDVPGLLLFGIFAAMCVVAFRRVSENASTATRPTGWTPTTLAIAAALVAASQIVMFAVMIVRHPPLYEIPDHRLWYYPLPFQAVAVALVVPVLGRIMVGWRGWRVIAVNAVLAALVLANVGQWHMHRELQRSSTWFSSVYHHSRALKLSLADGRPYTSHDGYSRFYRYCLTLSPEFRAKAERTGFLER